MSRRRSKAKKRSARFDNTPMDLESEDARRDPTSDTPLLDEESFEDVYYKDIETDLLRMGRTIRDLDIDDWG